ncbi:MAG: glycoside hydrolase family 18 protein [Planctomycetota bacterium]|nr:glycoside hydrolase family 18 protein [Planctomycetota bacterium]
MRYFLLAASVLLSLNTTGSQLEAQQGKRIVAYYTAWSIYARNFFITDIQAEKLTHINYAFANITNGEIALGDRWADIEKSYPGDSWDDPLRGNFNALLNLKERHPHVKTLISVGGWTWSGGFSDVAVSDESRNRFAASCVDFMTRYGFDGIDIDWEYPVGGGLETNRTRQEDRENFTLLLAELRRQVDERAVADGRTYLLTIAAPGGPGTYANIEIDRIHPLLDWINLMSYDFSGGWSDQTGLNAGLFAVSDNENKIPGLNAAAALEAYLDAGVPPTKLHMGVPFYGRGWRGVADENNGLHQPHRGVPTGTWENGVFDYSDLVDNYLPSYTRHWHEEAKVPWLYNADTGIMITYDDPESLALKVDYVNEQRLGGVMLWDLSSDDEQGSLLSVLHEGLRQPPAARFIRGDCNTDAMIDLTDAVYLLNYNFTGGPSPACAAACDADGDGQINGTVTDALYLLSFSFLGGAPPPPPFPACGTASRPSDEALGCEQTVKACRN